MNELALFAGAGGGILGGKLLGWKCVCAVEYEPAARRMLAARQDDGCLEPFPIWDDVRTFDGKPWRGLVDVVSGGFPCQDISAAGKGAGLDGERSGLWMEMARIIGEVRPRFAFVENSPMLTSRGLGIVLGDLAALGYDARWGVLGAINAGAPHKRDRIWIVASANSTGDESPEKQPGQICEPRRMGQAVADTESARLERHRPNPGESKISEPRNDGASVRHAAGAGLSDRIDRPMGEPGTLTESERPDWWATEPDVGRVAHGVASRVDRLRAIGNGQVPAVVRLAWNLLSQMNVPAMAPATLESESKSAVMAG